MEIITIFTLFILLGSLHNHYGYGQNYTCADSARCNLLRGDVFREAKKPQQQKEHYIVAEREYERYKDSKNCNISLIIKNCEKRLKECETKLNNDLITELKFPPDLVNEWWCPIASYPYVIFFCKTIQYWPEDLIGTLGWKTTICDDVCARMPEFEAFHLKRGILKKDFPTDWDMKKERFIQP